LLLVLDTNEYIYAFGTTKKPFSTALVFSLAEFPLKHKIRIPRTIVEEVRRNIIPEFFQEFVGFVSELSTIDEDIVVPFEIAFKYEVKGLKPADAFIAAYTEWVGANALVTENRHFLTRQENLPFKVFTAEKCLGILK